MQKIYSSLDLFMVGELKELLEKEGIDCEIKNEASSSLRGFIPLNESTPELWIQKNEDVNRALDLVRGWQSPAEEAGPNWKCAQCGEEVESQFGACWKCGTTRASSPE